ncbi:MAG: hypothetical protein DRJ69_04455 [Thermoprotei archaeon]|nr:MAG: hypothetical protein DRJ69_04455 [Thermoprotei archaeon]
MHKIQIACPIGLIDLSLTRGLEEYLKAIHRIQRAKGEVRVKDLSEAMKVRAASASEAVRRLARLGLVEHESYGSVKLTVEGLRRARELEERFSSLKLFLERVLGVEPAKAEEESCALEHFISIEAARKLAKLVEQRAGARRP